MTAPAPLGLNVINMHIAKRAPSRHDNAQSGHDLAQWVRTSLASQRPRLTRKNLIQAENTDQILSDLAEHATNPAAAI